MSGKPAATMKYVRLGKTGLKVSKVILGCMSYGSDTWADWVLNEDTALPLLKAAWDAGIQTWDTADMYSNGISEELIGKAIKKYDIPREKLIILTKCNFPILDDPYSGRFKPEQASSRDYVNKKGPPAQTPLLIVGLSRKHIFEALEASLKRLQMDYVDLLQIHRYDHDTPREETMKALHDLVQMGKVRYIGASSMYVYQFLGMQHVAELNGWTKFVSMQNYYNLLYREEEREMLPACLETGVGVIPWSPIARGALAKPLNSSSLRSETDGFLHALGLKQQRESEKKTINRVEELAKKKGYSMAQIATAWILSKNTVTAPIVGLNSAKRINEMVEAVNIELSEEDIKFLEQLYVPKAVAGGLS